MQRITKKTRREDGPRAAVSKLKDARNLMDTIRIALDREITERTDDLAKTDIGWTHFDDAARLLEELKDVGHLLLIDRNEVRYTVCGCEHRID